MIDLLPVRKILAEIFPSNITINGQYLGDAFKVIMTDHTIALIKEGNKGPEVFEEIVWDRYEGSRRKTLTVYSDEDVYEFSRSENCGCGNRLRGYTPYRYVPFAPIQ